MADILHSLTFEHLERMTDDTGLLEHSLGAIPRRNEGYTTDDNARALWVCLAWQDLLPADGQEDPRRARLERLAERYAAFLLWAQREDGRFQNDFHYDRTPEREVPSDDCFGRSLWASAIAFTQSRQPALWLPAEALLLRSVPRIGDLVHLRGQAYALAACSLLMRHPSLGSKRAHSLEWRRVDQACRQAFHRLRDSLLQAYHANRSSSWRWFEPNLTYSNATLPWALLYSHEIDSHAESLEVGLEALEFLIERMTSPEGWIRPIGNRGWATVHCQALWDQQPLETMKLALAASQAYRITEESRYLETLEACRRWFSGHNDAGRPLADPVTGACCDGITPDGPNVNQGAEAMISFLLTESIYCQVKKQEKLPVMS